MGRGTESKDAVIFTLKGLLLVAVVVCLLASLASWAVGLAAQAVPALAEALTPASPSPTPTGTDAPSSPPATAEPTANAPAEVPTSSPTETPAVAPTATATAPEPTPTSEPDACTDHVEFLADVTVADGAVFGPHERFVKTWRVRNAGSCDWTGYRVVFSGGESMGAPEGPILDTPAGEVVDVSLEMTAPEGPGEYTGKWQVRSPDGVDLGTLTCVINVKDGGVDPVVEPTPIPPPAPPAEVNEERWIDVNLSEQVLTAYEGRTPVRTTLVSTGLPGTPTPVGQFRIWIKFRYDDMAGADYYIEDVPYVMYFHGGYGLHGVTWHGNFGHPMSHGCVNLPTGEAEWLFNWADVGTLVNVHD